MSPTVTTKGFKQKEVVWQQYRLCLSVAEHQILGGKHFLILGPESGKIWWLQKVQYLQKKYHCQWTFLRGRKPKWIFHNFGNLLRPLELVPASRERVVPTEWQVRTVLGDCISKTEVISIQAPQYRQYALISDFKDIAHLSIQEQAALASNWIKDRLAGLALQNLALATMTGLALSNLLRNLTADVQYAINNCESRATIDPSRESIGTCKEFPPAYGSPLEFWQWRLGSKKTGTWRIRMRWSVGENAEHSRKSCRRIHSDWPTSSLCQRSKRRPCRRVCRNRSCQLKNQSRPFLWSSQRYRDDPRRCEACRIGKESQEC